MAKLETCPLCKQPLILGYASPMVHTCDCENCGHFAMDKALAEELAAVGDADNRPFELACLLYELKLQKSGRRLGVYCDKASPELTGSTAVQLPVNDLLARFPKPTEFIDRALLNLSRLAKHPLETIYLDQVTHELVFFSRSSEAFVLVQYMERMGLTLQTICHTEGVDLVISPAGWQRIEQLQHVTPDSRQGFVAMWFSPKTEAIYRDGIGPAIKDAGYKPNRIDLVEHNNKVCDEIVAAIRRSRFVVADFTAGCCKGCDGCQHAADCRDKVRPRGGVYFEAGFAKGLGLEVIWLVRQDQVDQVHFDTRQYNHIVYEDAEDLRVKLRNRIAATIH